MGALSRFNFGGLCDSVLVKTMLVYAYLTGDGSYDLVELGVNEFGVASNMPIK